jgi:hypothetical protein
MDRSNTMDLSKRSKSDPAISQRSKKVVSENLLNLKPSYSTPLPLLNPTKEQEIGYPEHQGWVYKKSNRYKTWNKRWFVLYGQNLFYFKHPTVNIMFSLLFIKSMYH